ncbi:MAG: hypothetical protein HRK26_00040 [Rickettsiaceae bacterium H1]|nr:hypothetical protein [Rickettsiaceae bacterium H1]
MASAALLIFSILLIIATPTLMINDCCKQNNDISQENGAENGENATKRTALTALVLAFLFVGLSIGCLIVASILLVAGQAFLTQYVPAVHLTLMLWQSKNKA